MITFKVALSHDSCPNAHNASGGRTVPEYKEIYTDEFCVYLACTKCNDKVTVYVRQPESF